MENLQMKKKLERGDCLDVTVIGEPVEGFEGEVWKLKEYREDFDYCDAAHEKWIWSIGKRVTDNRIFASVDTRFYQNPMFTCLWLREK